MLLLLGLTCSTDFNSHAHVERDVEKYIVVPFVHYFNSHAHVERDGRTYSGADGGQYFNSHAHVERDVCGKRC